MSTHNRPQPPARIEYDGFVLRPVEPTDILQIEKALQSSLKELNVFTSWSHHPSSRECFFDRVVTQWWNYYRGEEYEMALFNSKGEFLVYSGFYPTARINPNCFEIGFWTASAHKGKGFATLATQMQIIFIFEYLKGDRIEITSNLDNAASLKIIEKCGFIREGVLRNFYPQGTPEMYAAGYTKEKRVVLSSLIPTDCPSLLWYEPMLKKMTLFPVLEPPIRLR